MLLKISASALILILGSLSVVTANAKPITRELTLVLPQQSSAKALFYQRKAKSVAVSATDKRFLGPDGLEWMMRLEQTLDRAYEQYRKAFAIGELSFCSAPQNNRPFSHIIFFNFKQSTDADSRAGFFHRNNPGIVVQDKLWDAASATDLIIHESVHSWCLHRDYTSSIEEWIEEGAADWVSYKTLGQTAQLPITRYFESPCTPTLYGASFLWWVARNETDETPKLFLRKLAALHLGLRLDVVYGKINEVSCLETQQNVTVDKQLPHAFLLKSTPPTTYQTRAIPYLIRPGGVPDLRPQQNGTLPTGYFIWDGPLPHQN